MEIEGIIPSVASHGKVTLIQFHIITRTNWSPKREKSRQPAFWHILIWCKWRCNWYWATVRWTDSRWFRRITLTRWLKISIACIWWNSIGWGWLFLFFWITNWFLSPCFRISKFCTEKFRLEPGFWIVLASKIRNISDNLS